MIDQIHRLDVIPGGTTVVIHVKQYQTDESLKFELYSRMGDFEIDANFTECTVRGTKSDGNGYSATAECIAATKEITVQLTEQMTAVAGIQPYEITVTDDTGRMITATFLLYVHRAALDANTVVSESVIREVQTIVEDYIEDHPGLFVVDDTLTVSGEAADAKVTGRRIGDIESALTDGLSTNIIKWTENAYIKDNVSAGTVVSLTPATLAGYRCAVVDCEPGDRFVINAVGKSTPRAWAFLDSSNALLTVSPTMKTYTNYLIIAPENAAKLVLNDAPAGGEFTTVSIKGGYAAEDIASLRNEHINNNNGVYGGENYAYFEQGSASFQNGVLVPTNNDLTLRSYRLTPTLLRRNTEIVVASGFRLYVIQVKETPDGYERVQNITNGYVEGRVSISNTGLFIFILKKTDDTVITPADAETAVLIKHSGAGSGVNLNLPKNPYRNIVWSRVRDLTSVSHAHCTTQEQFDTLRAKYDHVAISNYHPSIPYYPLTDYFQNAEGVLCSPNAEHYAFDDVSSSVHMNSVGGLLSCEDGGYNGSIFDAIEDGCRSLIAPNGGGMTLNHPNWSGLSAADVKRILSFGGTFAIEIWNATCEQLSNTGYALDVWDAVLSDGIQVFGTCVPDHEAQYRPAEDRHPFGYNHMLVINETEDEVLYAYRTGKFYGTLYNDGLTLKSYTLTNGQLDIEVSEASTFLFKTATRSVSISTAATTASFAVTDSDIYVRCEATRGNNKLFTNAIIL